MPRSFVISILLLVCFFVLAYRICKVENGNKLLNTIVVTLVGLAAIYVVLEIVLFIIKLYGQGYDG